MNALRKAIACTIVAAALGTAPAAQADVICSPSWGHGLPQICVDVPAANVAARAMDHPTPPPFAAQRATGR